MREEKISDRLVSLSDPDARPIRKGKLGKPGEFGYIVQIGSRRTRKRLARYRTGCEGRSSHLKRGYGLRRSRLKGYQGQRIWTGWAILAYNLDTLAIHTT